jgi:hypothetical protein
LCIGFHTGIKIGAYFGYGGTRFFNNSDWATEIFSVGNGDGNVRVVNTLYVGGNVALHAGNVATYALPISGGALTGTLSVSTTSSGAANRTLVIKNSGQSVYDFGSYAGAWRSALQLQSNSNNRLLFFAPPEDGYEYGIIRSANGGLNIDVGGTLTTTGTTGIRIETSGAVSMPGTLNVVGAVTQNGNQVLHAGNYTSYPDATKLPLAGGTLTGALNGTSASFSSVVDATQFRDSNDVAYYLDPAGTSNLNQWSTTTAARLGRSRYWTNRHSWTADAGYHTGTNGWSTDEGTWASAWKGGFSGWDMWGSNMDHPQGAGYVHAQGIVSGLHASTTNGSSAYGWMMVGAHAATDNRYWLRGKWNTSTSGWVEMLTSGNASYALAMNQNVGTGNSPSFTGLSVINTITGSITGNAGTATSLANFTNQSGARYTTDFNSIVTTGFFNAEATPTNSPGGSYGQLISVKGIDTGLQIYGGYVNDNLWFRGWHTSGGTFTAWRTVIHSGNIASQTVATAGSCTGNAASASSVAWTNVSGRPTAVSSFSNDSGYITSGGSISGSAGSVAASGITGQTGMWTSAARPGPYRLYRRDSDDAYSVQTYWTGSYWRLDGYYSNNTVHAGCIVAYADAAASSASCSGNAASVTDGVYLSTNQSISGVKTFSSPPVATNIAKAWVHYDMNNNTINASYNVSSVTDNGTGVCTVNFSTAMVDANYVVAGTATYGYDDQDIYGMILTVPRRSTAQQAGSCRLATEFIHGAQVYDCVAVRAVFYR